MVVHMIIISSSNNNKISVAPCQWTASHCFTVTLLYNLKSNTDRCNSHSRTPHNSKLTQILWDFPCVRAQSHATKRYLAVEQLQVMCVERIRPVLFCAVSSFVAANYSSEKSRCGLLTKWQTAGSSLIQKWWDKLTCIKSEKLFRIYISDKLSRIYTAMYKSMYKLINIPPWILQLSGSLRWWERARMITVR